MQTYPQVCRCPPRTFSGWPRSPSFPTTACIVSQKRKCTRNGCLGSPLTRNVLISPLTGGVWPKAWPTTHAPTRGESVSCVKFHSTRRRHQGNTYTTRLHPPVKWTRRDGPKTHVLLEMEFTSTLQIQRSGGGAIQRKKKQEIINTRDEKKAAATSGFTHTRRASVCTPPKQN